MVVLGRIIGPRGIKGQIKVAPFTEYIDGLMDYPVWWLSSDEKSWQTVHPASFFIHDNLLITTLGTIPPRLCLVCSFWPRLSCVIFPTHSRKSEAFIIVSSSIDVPAHWTKITFQRLMQT